MARSSRSHHRRAGAVAGVLGLGLTASAPLAGGQLAAENAGGWTTAAGPPRALASVARVRAIRCRTACAGFATATRGSVVRVVGSGLGTASRIVFLGGAADGRSVPATPVGPGTLEVRVPRWAARGARLMTLTADGVLSAASRARLAVAGPRPVPTRRRVQARMRVAGPRGPTAGARRVHLAFLVRARGAVDVTVDLVRDGGRTVLRRWRLAGVHSGSVRDLVWRGRLHGAPAPEGRYAFRLTAWPALSGGPAGAAEPKPARISVVRRASRVLVRSATFLVTRHAFPLRGRHAFGTGDSRFGGARHHQGQDVVARCGTPIVAAAGGRVRQRAFESRAGNYLVIDSRDGRGQAYMHLRDPALVARGTRVQMGQRIGYVGATGHATGCHLHFELWTAPGWHRGHAHPIDPLPALRLWDRR